MLLNELERYPEALQVVEDALKIDENNVDILSAKSQILYNTKEWSKSLMCINTILEIDENNIGALNAKGAIFLRLQDDADEGTTLVDYDKDDKMINVYVIALNCFKKVLSMDEHNYFALYNKCLALFDSGEHRQAITFCAETFRDTGEEDFKKLHKELKQSLIEAQENYGDLKKQKRNKIIIVTIAIIAVGFFASITGISIYRTVVDGWSFGGTGAIKLLAITTFLLICTIIGLRAAMKSYKQQEEHLGYVPKDIPDL